MDIGKYYDVWFEYTEAEFDLKLLSLPGYTSDTYDGFLFERRDGRQVFVRNFSKIVERK